MIKDPIVYIVCDVCGGDELGSKIKLYLDGEKLGAGNPDRINFSIEKKTIDKAIWANNWCAQDNKHFCSETCKSRYLDRMGEEKCKHKWVFMGTIQKTECVPHATLYIRIDEFYCENCMEKAEKEYREESREYPDWWDKSKESRT